MTEQVDNTVHPSSVPPNVPFNLLGCQQDAEVSKVFIGVLNDIVVECGRFMDLSLLDGITIGFDYDAALESVDLGYESSIAKGYTNTNDLIGVAKTLRVRRNGAIKGHVVYNANYLMPIVEDVNDPQWMATANLIVHELAHVCEIAWFNGHSPGVMLEPFKGDWLRGQLLDAAHTCWEEYAACRLACVFESAIVRENYLKASISQTAVAFSRAHESIKSYRTHGDLHRVIYEHCDIILNPLKMLSYLLGHIDGSEVGEDFNSEYQKFSDFSPFVKKFQDELRNAWESRFEWDGLNGLTGIVDIYLEVFRAAGMVLTLDTSQEGGSSRADFPFSPETLPGG